MQRLNNKVQDWLDQVDNLESELLVFENITWNFENLRKFERISIQYVNEKYESLLRKYQEIEVNNTIDPDSEIDFDDYLEKN